jgi:glucose/arabinose dehydrogenase
VRLSLVLVSLVLLGGCSAGPQGDANGLGTPPAAPQPTTQTAEPSATSTAGPRVLRTIARALAVPWGVTFLPDGTALVGERDTTRVLAISPAGSVREVGRIAAASPRGEAGLLGLAASPSFAQDRLVFAYVSTAEDNRVVKFRYDGSRIDEPTAVLTGIPNGFIHDGGRLLFDPDGNLFVSTGETGRPELAQDPDSLGGKILHITPSGDASPDNPVPGSPVWTMGHRNVQGLAFDASGRLWATEFGADTWDELNRIDRGRNYGWPLFEGRGNDRRYRDPYVEWRTSEASPSGLAFLDGYLWAASLRGERLWRVPVTADGLGKAQDFFVGDYGRLRTVTVAPDGNLWVTTSNRDGRGTPRAGDDRILLVKP